MNQLSDIDLVILAGGKGTRLSSVLGNKPKPLATIDGKSLLERQIELAASTGITTIRLMIHHLADHIRDALGNGDRWNVKLVYHEEKVPLGTAGCVLEACQEFSERFFVFYGDTLIDVDLFRVFQHHVKSKAEATLFIHPNSHPYDSDLIEIDNSGWITAFHGYPHSEGYYLPNLVNAALYLIENSALKPWTHAVQKMDFAKHLFPKMIDAGAKILGYKSREYIKDMGTPDRLEQGERDLKSGKLQKLSYRQSASALFLDRDGTINVEKNLISDPEDIELIDNAARAIESINRSGSLAVVITNQPLIARGDCTESELRTIHHKLETELGKNQAYLDAIYYCPHHPHSGYPGEVVDLKIDCECRKPKCGLIEKAITDLDIDRTSSWMIGDSTTDIEAGQRAGLKSILVKTGHAGRDSKSPAVADYEFGDLYDAAEFALVGFEKLFQSIDAIKAQLLPQRLIMVGGLSRSGKSTWSNTCKRVLEGETRKVHSISLDSWIVDNGNRVAGDVTTRFRISEINRFLESIVIAQSTIEIDYTLYDRWSKRQSRDYKRSIKIDSNDIVIIDGVIALADFVLPIEEFVGGPVFRIYIDAPISTVRDRFERDYSQRGLSAAEVDDLWRERAIDEFPIVSKSKSTADLVVHLNRL